jgi:hypothetical protein
MSIGDGSIFFGKPRGVYFSINHSNQQKDYLQWKMNLVDSNNCLTNPGSFQEYYTNFNGKQFKQYSARWCDTKRLAEYRQLLYVNGEKTVQNVLCYLSSPLSIAILFMDDGSIFKRKRRHKDGSIYYLKPSMKLCTHSYTKRDNELILEWLQDLHSIQGYIVIERKKKRDKEYYTLNFNTENTFKIWEIIKSYVSQVDSMMHKFEFIYNYYSRLNL